MCCGGQSSEDDESSETVESSEAVNVTSNSSQSDDVAAAEFYVAKVDFAYVDTPLLVVVWVLFTAAVKIGQSPTLSTAL